MDKRLLLVGFGVAFVATFAVLVFLFGVKPGEAALASTSGLVVPALAEVARRRQAAASSATAAQEQVSALAQSVRQRDEEVERHDDEVTDEVALLTPEEKAAAGNTLFDPKGGA
jgi:hypothetical protein